MDACSVQSIGGTRRLVAGTRSGSGWQGGDGAARRCGRDEIGPCAGHGWTTVYTQLSSSAVSRILAA
eukprot:359260-Chlamydomonas_euryale.AAC.4